jgi:hypothetical protein
MLKTNILNDLESLFNDNFIAEARNLNEALGNHYFNENMQPMYFNGKLDAKTVMIMLNPGNGDDPKHPYSFEKQKKNFNSLEDFQNKHLDSLVNFGLNHFNDKLDNFDLKQAAFLHNFKNLDFEIPNEFWINEDLKRIAKRNVLMDKLQLEFIPYPSRDFKGLLDSIKLASQNIGHLKIYIYRILDTIIEHPRNNVFFCSKQFYNLFSVCQKIEGFNAKIEMGSIKEFKDTEGKLTLRFSKVNIYYKDNIINAGIAHSFASQALPNAYKKMMRYGEFCYNEMKK